MKHRGPPRRMRPAPSASLASSSYSLPRRVARPGRKIRPGLRGGEITDASVVYFRDKFLPSIIGYIAEFLSVYDVDERKVSMERFCEAANARGTYAGRRLAGT